MDPNETNAYWYGYRVGYSRGRQDGLPWVREIVERRRQQAREGGDPCGVAACNDILAGIDEAGTSRQGQDQRPHSAQREVRSEDITNRAANTGARRAE